MCSSDLVAFAVLQRDDRASAWRFGAKVFGALVAGALALGVIQYLFFG